MLILELLTTYAEQKNDETLAAVLLECKSRMRDWKSLAQKKFRKHLTEQEIEQEILRGTISVIQNFDLSRFDGRDIGALFYGYASQRAIGAVHDYFDSKTRFKRETTNTLDAATHDVKAGFCALLGIETVSEVEQKEFWKIIFRILQNCKTMPRLTFLLVHWEGWSQVEVAKYFGFSEARAAQLMKAAVEYLQRSRTLKKYMEGQRNCTDVSKAPKYFIIPSRPTCSAIGCERKAKGRGRCWRHRSLAHKEQCKAPGCGSTAESHGMCALHVRRVKLYGSTEARKRTVNAGNTCLECHDKPAETKGLCTGCYSLKQYHRRAEAGYFDTAHRRAKIRMYAKRQYQKRKANGYFQRPEVQAKIKAYNATPERKAKQKASSQERWAREKAARCGTSSNDQTLLIEEKLTSSTSTAQSFIAEQTNSSPERELCLTGL